MSYWSARRISAWIQAVSRIRDIFLDTDPRIRTDLWLTDPASDPAFFVSDLQDANKNNFPLRFLCLFLFEGTFTSFFKAKKSLSSHITLQIKAVLHFYCLLTGRIRIRTINLRIRIQEDKTYGSGTLDTRIRIVHERPERSWLICETCPARCEGEPPPTSQAVGPGFLNKCQKVNKKKINKF